MGLSRTEMFDVDQSSATSMDKIHTFDTDKVFVIPQYRFLTLQTNGSSHALLLCLSGPRFSKMSLANSKC